MRLEMDASLSPGTKVYRYLSLESFLGLIEARQTYVTRLSSWDDKWEAILEKVPTVDDKGHVLRAINVFYADLFGQSWTILPESDALWRIYSPSRTGVMISTTVRKFELIQGLDSCYIGRVVYFDGVADMLEKVTLANPRFRSALLKRSAFKHEEEVRLLTHLGALPVDYTFQGMHVNLELDPVPFVESITLDPRADDWFVTAMERYCNRAGLGIEPVKSALYDPDPHLKLGVVKQYVPVPR